MKPADAIALRLLDFCRSTASDIILPNYYVGRYEMDVMKIMSSGYVYEYEIKTSRADYLADFRKQHHEVDQAKTRGLRTREIIERYGSIPYIVTNKCETTRNGLRANRFFYVVPDNLISAEECPDYVGLIYFNGNRMIAAKNAPLLHKNKGLVKIAEVAHKMAYREQNLRMKIQRLSKPKTKKIR